MFQDVYTLVQHLLPGGPWDLDSFTLELSARSKDRATCKVEAISSVCTTLKAVKGRDPFCIIMQSY